MTAEFDSPTPQPSQQSRHWALGAHLAGLLAGYVVPFGGILAPMVIWLVKRDDDPYVGEQALEAMNFQITVTLALLACVPLVLLMGIGLLLLIPIVIGSVVLAILAAVAAAEGRDYRYPYCLRLVTG